MLFCLFNVYFFPNLKRVKQKMDYIINTCYLLQVFKWIGSTNVIIYKIYKDLIKDTH
jgi:hypothetical protein